MKEIGQIIEIKNDQQVLVRVARTASCNGCKACSMGRDDKKYIDIVVDNTLGADLGDNIEIDLDSPDVLKAAAIAYIFPLIAMVGSTLISYYFLFPENQALAGIIGIVFMFLAFLTIRLNENRIKDTKTFLPKMVAIMRKDEPL